MYKFVWRIREVEYWWLYNRGCIAFLLFVHHIFPYLSPVILTLFSLKLWWRAHLCHKHSFLWFITYSYFRHNSRFAEIHFSRIILLPTFIFFFLSNPIMCLSSTDLYSLHPSVLREYCFKIFIFNLFKFFANMATILHSVGHQ